MKNYFLILLWALFISSSLQAKTKIIPADNNHSPQRLIFMVFDQMRPDYVDRFDLKNFKRLSRIGHNFKKSYVGHSASVTVVSHVVMTTGLLPKDLPWSDETYIDKDGLAGDKNAVLNPTRLKPDIFFKILSQVPKENFLSYLLKEKTHRKVLAFGEKDYATMGMAGPYADSITFLENNKGVCHPNGINVPSYISEDDRFTVDCSNAYGTENSFYKMDGNRFYPGKDPKHLGGDVWVADAGLKALENNPDLSGLFLTFGAIDKFGHMTGEPDGDYPLSFTPPAHLKDICKIADAQLGRILDYLEKNKLLASTMIVATADHGGQTDKVFLGDGSWKEASGWAERVTKLAKIKSVQADTSLRFWLADLSKENMDKATALLRESSRITRIYQKTFKDEDGKKKYFFKEVYNAVKKEPLRFQKWANAHDEELVNTMANEGGPDLIGLLGDQVGYNKLGDHGGNQEAVQRIPMYIVGPLEVSDLKKDSLRLVDIMGIVRKAFQF